MKVTIYGADWCKPCQNTKQLALESGCEVEFKDITSEPKYLEEATNVLGFKPTNVPHVVVDGEYVGQATEFKEFLQKHK